MDYTTLIFPTISAIIAASSFLFSYQRASKSELDKVKANAIALEQTAKSNFEKIKQDAVALEHRLTLNEQNQFNEHDRRCLQEVDLKMGLIWTTVKEDFPSLLKQTSTPRFDALLDKAQKNVKSMSSKEIEELLRFLEREIKEGKESTTPGRAAIAAFYRAVVQYEAKRVGVIVGC